MSIFVAIKAFWFSVLEVFIELSNVHGLSLPSVGYSCTGSVVVSSFCELVSLSD